MLGTEPSANWIGQNRAPYGARYLDLALTSQIDWEVWSNHQLNAPPGPEWVLPRFAMPIAPTDEFLFH